MKRTQELPALNSVRGIAILLVVASHFMPSSLSHYGQLPGLIGKGGVILFFFLSGFLMERAATAGTSLINYGVRRAFRIFPMYLLSIILIYSVEPKWSLSDVFLNASFTAQIAQSPLMSGVYWTLYIEVIFYALVPLLIALGVTAIKLSTYCAVGFVLSLLLIHKFTHSQTTGFELFYIVYCFAGMQLGAWSGKKISDLSFVTSMAGTAIPSIIMLHWLGLASLFCIIILTTALRSKARLPALEFVGRVSYSWYLLHMTGITVFNLIMPEHTEWALSPIVIVASFLASVVAFYLVEQPGIYIGKRITELLRERGYLSQSLQSNY